MQRSEPDNEILQIVIEKRAAGELTRKRDVVREIADRTDNVESGIYRRISGLITKGVLSEELLLRDDLKGGYETHFIFVRTRSLPDMDVFKHWKNDVVPVMDVIEQHWASKDPQAASKTSDDKGDYQAALIEDVRRGTPSKSIIVQGAWKVLGFDYDVIIEVISLLEHRNDVHRYVTTWLRRHPAVESTHTAIVARTGKNSSPDGTAKTPP